MKIASVISTILLLSASAQANVLQCTLKAINQDGTSKMTIYQNDHYDKAFTAEQEVVKRNVTFLDPVTNIKLMLSGFDEKKLYRIDIYEAMSGLYGQTYLLPSNGVDRIYAEAQIVGKNLISANCILQDEK